MGPEVLTSVLQSMNGSSRHFGSVVARANNPPTHVFQVRNTAPVSLEVQVINVKPCCGIVEPTEPSSLSPGQVLPVTVRLKAGSALGSVRHLAMVQTRGGGSGLELVTTASFHPPVVIEPRSSIRPVVKPGQVGLLEYTITTYSTPSQPPPSLETASIRCDLPFRWVSD